MNKGLLFKLTMVISLLTTACQKDDQMAAPSSLKPKSDQGCVVLGDKIPDPYSLTYMVPAFENMKSAGFDFPFTTIDPTGYYVRVLVESDSVKNILTDDSSIVWFNYPLDYEVSEDGYYYEDADCVGNQEYLYAVIPVGYTFEVNCESTILDSVFIPSDYPSQGAYETSFDALEDEAYKLSGDTASCGSKSSNKVYRRATITVKDDRLGEMVPLQGVRVKFKQHSKTAWGITDSYGVAVSSKKFKSRYVINYSIEWYREDWRIKEKPTSGRLKDAIFTGPLLSGDWTLPISHNNPKLLMQASVHKALLLTYYSSLWTIEKPTKRWGRKINVVCVDGESDIEGQVGHSNCSDNASDEDVVIWERKHGQSGDLTTDQLMAVTLHEMAHWSQYKRSGFLPIISNCITESWAECVKWDIMTRYYNIPHTGYDGGIQDWNQNTEQNKDYSPLFIDLIDDYNQSRGNSEYPNDVVSGYNLKFIQDSIIQDVFSYDLVTSNMFQHKRPGVTDAHLRQLLLKYDEVF